MKIIGDSGEPPKLLEKIPKSFEDILMNKTSNLFGHLCWDSTETNECNALPHAHKAHTSSCHPCGRPGTERTKKPNRGSLQKEHTFSPRKTTLFLAQSGGITAGEKQEAGQVAIILSQRQLYWLENEEVTYDML